MFYQSITEFVTKCYNAAIIEHITDWFTFFEEHLYSSRTFDIFDCLKTAFMTLIVTPVNIHILHQITV